MSGVAYIEFTPTHPWAQVPVPAYHGDAGLDLVSVAEVVIYPGERCDIPTGLTMAMPVGFYGRIVGRSSAIRKKNLLVVEGIIDCGFRGELLCHAYHVPRMTGSWVNPEPMVIRPGDSVAQLIISPIPAVKIHVVEKLPDSERGERGFGSSGR